MSYTNCLLHIHAARGILAFSQYAPTTLRGLKKNDCFLLLLFPLYLSSPWWPIQEDLISALTLKDNFFVCISVLLGQSYCLSPLRDPAGAAGEKAAQSLQRQAGSDALATPVHSG